MKKYNASIQQMAELQAQKEQANKEEKEAYKIKKQTHDLLPNADENIIKLQVIEGGEFLKMSIIVDHVCKIYTRISSSRALNV